MNYLLFEELCKENGTSPTALSKKLGLSKGNTSNWKNGGNPSVEILCKIADELNCTTDDLLGREKRTGDIGIQNSTVTNSSNVEVTGIKHETVARTNEFSETTAELVRVFELLPVKARIRLMNMVYDFEEKYQQGNTN